MATEGLSVLDALVKVAPAATTHSRAEGDGDEQATSCMLRQASGKGAGPENKGGTSRRLDTAPKQHEPPTVELTGKAVGAVDIQALENLGPTGVRALLDPLRLGAGAYGLYRRPGHAVDGIVQAGGDEIKAHESGGINATDLARIVRSSDPNAELLAIGVGARLHRVRILSALGVGRAQCKTTASIGAS